MTIAHNNRITTMAKFKYGEFNCATLKPKWDYEPTKGDKGGFLRGGVGIDGNFDKDGKDYMKTADPKADAKNYYPPTGVRRDGAMMVMYEAGTDPGTIVNKGKQPPGYYGVDE
jgi:hypothetical protein